jgi:hypothetical protein
MTPEYLKMSKRGHEPEIPDILNFFMKMSPPAEDRLDNWIRETTRRTILKPGTYSFRNQLRV